MRAAGVDLSILCMYSVWRIGGGLHDLTYASRSNRPISDSTAEMIARARRQRGIARLLKQRQSRRPSRGRHYSEETVGPGPEGQETLPP